MRQRLSFVFALIAFIAAIVSLLWLFRLQEDWQMEMGKVSDSPWNEEKAPDFPVGVNAISVPLPDSIDFCGEPVPLQIPDVKERLDHELQINAYWHNHTIFIIKKAHRWFPIIEPVLKEYGIPDDFKYLVAIESSFEETAQSGAGASGFWQLLEGTAKQYGLIVNRNIDERNNPLKATVAACKFLNWAHDKLGNWTLVAAAYNRGVRGIQEAMDKQKIDSYYDLLLNDQTSRYVFRILAMKQILENPTKYGFELKPQDLYAPLQVHYDTVDEDIKDLVEYAHQKGINYKLLKWYNPWMLRDNLNLHRHQEVIIALPDTVY